MKKIIRNPRKGVTLVELVIALSVISIITVAAISMLHSTIKIEVKSAAIIEANNTVESIVEAFNYAENKDEFSSIISNLHGQIQIPVGNEGEYKIDRGTYEINIIYTYTDNYSKIEINAIYSDGYEIYKDVTYFKGM